MDNHTLIVRPMITEKSVLDSQKGKYTFVVAKAASKAQIQQVVEETFGVHVTGIATTITKGKTKRMGRLRNETSLPSVKKAVIRVKSGEKIALFDLTTEAK